MFVHVRDISGTGGGIMTIDTGLAIVIVAVLIFYLRLIILQRERVKRLAQAPQPAEKVKGKAKQATPAPNYSILSQKPMDRAIAAVGAMAILAGILLYGRVIPSSVLHPYWWIPTTAGILAFSWAFKL
jgi:hypothetical protein